jgi:DNA-binding LacI/PurR family transcriptional regulator
VPDHMFVIGFHNMAIVERLPPPLRTAWLPMHQIGELSAHVLLAEIEGGPQNTGAVQTLLGVRETTASRCPSTRRRS